MRNLKRILDRFYGAYDFNERLRHDPIEFPHRYKNPRDIEVSAFIASSLAYGKVEQFKAAAGKILSGMGAHPHEFLLEFRPEKHGKLFEGIKYRFNENQDLLALLHILHKALTGNASLEGLFMRYWRPDSPSVREGLSGFAAALLSTDTSRIYGENVRPPGLRQLFPSPLDGSACKRAALFLRWMVRDSDIDFGIWKGIPKNRLIIPLDTHIARISACLGFTKRKSQDWKTAVEITEALKRYDPEDPLKYDFALCHQGISGKCSGKKGDTGCRGCCFRN